MDLWHRSRPAVWERKEEEERKPRAQKQWLVFQPPPLSQLIKPLPTPLQWALVAGTSILALGFIRSLRRRFKGNVQRPFVGVFGKNAQDIRVRFDFSPSDIAHKTDEIITISERTHDAVAAVPLSEVSYERVISPLAMLEAEQFALAQSCEFPSMVSTSKAIRDASTEAEKKLDAHNVKCSMRVDVYRVVKAYAQTKPKLEAEAQRYLDRLIRDFERLGLSLSPETRAEVERLKTRMGELSIQYQRNLNEENTILHLTEEELAGMPEDFIKGLNKRQDDGKYEVTLKYPHYFPIMEQCKVGQTRQIMEKAFNSRCMAENAPILEELIYLRHQMSQLLGYKTHAHYILDIRMAKTPEKVMEFLNGVSVKIGPLAQKELERLKELKKEEEGSAIFTMADFRYYMRRSEKLEFNIDHEALKEYFPIDVVTEGLFKIYQQLLGLKFTEVPDPHTWHADVQLFAVKDLETEEPLGYFYLDLYPREGKYGHACVCPLQPGCYLLDGSRMRPVAAMLANFSKPTNNKPSLLKHSEVETYFHEFGHVMHHICSHVSFARFSGTRVERDFVEAPSQMLENWCWEKPSLKLMSGYYKDKSTPIPDTLCDTLVSTKKAHAGLLTKRQLLFGLFDQAIHTTQRADTALVLKALHPQVMMGIPATEGTNFAASFGHLAGGYDASYYGYMWSEVFSADMFASKFKDNVLSRPAGREYRDKVLRPGGSLDAAVILRNFLGREPTDEAFLESKGVTKARLALAASKAKGPASGSGVSAKGV